MNKNDILLTLLIIFLTMKVTSLQKTTVAAKQNNVSTVRENELTTSSTFAATDVTSSTCSNNSCTLNSSSVTTIASTIQTTSSPTITNSSTSETIISPTGVPSFEKKHASIKSGKHICICDLKLNYCDLNCCCDEDCSFADKLVFNHCEKDFHHYDTRLCDYMQHIYINNTLQERQINQNGLFCVTRSNSPPSYLIQRKQPLKSLQETEYQKINKYSWPEVTDTPTTPFFPINYTYGEQVWIIRNKSIATLHLNPSGCPAPSSPEARMGCRKPVMCRTNKDCPMFKQCCDTGICGAACMVPNTFPGYKY